MAKIAYHRGVFLFVLYNTVIIYDTVMIAIQYNQQQQKYIKRDKSNKKTHALYTECVINIANCL